MKARKILVSIAALALVAAISIGGTIAYLTSQDQVKNTFTVGKVKITLDEARVNQDGDKLYVPNDKTEDENFKDYTTDSTNATIAKRVKANDYKLLPGHTYTKDPTVTVKAGSEESYVRMLVTVTFDKQLTDEQLATNLDNIFVGYNSNNWVRNAKDVKIVDDKTVITYEYRYNTTVSAGTTDNKLPALFTGIKVPGEWTNEDLAAIGAFNIGIVAEAIQADGFTTADLAWAAFN